MRRQTVTQELYQLHPCNNPHQSENQNEKTDMKEAAARKTVLRRRHRSSTTGSAAGSAPVHKIKTAGIKISQAKKFQSGEATGVHRKPGCTPGSVVRFRDAENEESQRPCSLNEDSNGAERKTLVTRELEQILRDEQAARTAFDPRQRNRC
jgi:hypothetical protein